MTASEQNLDDGLVDAAAFFQRAEEVAVTENFDYAIDLYLEGLKRAPDAVEQGHKPLRALALLRQSKGGRKPSVLEKMKHSRGTDPLKQMLHAEYLLAKDPHHLPYAEVVLKAAAEAGYKKLTQWMADLLFEAENGSKKSSAATYLLLRDCYVKIGLFEKAIRACQYAAKLKPDDASLKTDLRDLYAQLTVQKGHYDQEGDFRKSIKDREKQELLQAQESVVKTMDYRILAVEQARNALARKPDSAVNIAKLADALADVGEDKYENEAIELLEKNYARTRDFAFKQHAGKIRIRQVRRKVRAAAAISEAEPENTQAKAELSSLERQLNETELEHYRLCVENYPTDVRLKYQLGLRFMLNRRFDEAIPMFQEARKDPHTSIAAMNKMGMCFYLKGWFADAIDIFRQAIASYEIKDDDTGKDLRYNLARAYEEQGDKPQALELYRKLAQVDFSYRDVSQRVEKLRKTGEDPTSQ